MKPKAAKRQLDFSQKKGPLDGCSFYLDLQGYKDLNLLETRLTALGATVETFLSKKVSYFVTRSSLKRTATTFRRSPRRHASQVTTRAHKMLREASLQRSNSPSTALQRAKALGLSIQRLEKVLRWLKEVESNAPQAKFKVVHKTLESVSRSLKTPFLKVEDKSRAFQPVYKELNTFPKVHFNTAVDESPFDESRVQTRLSGRGKLPQSKTRRTSTRSGSGHFKAAIKSSNSRTGYCELCDVLFTNRGHHLKGEQHRSNITSDNYGKLDEMIASGGNFKAFMEELKQNKIRRTPKKMSPGKASSPLTLFHDGARSKETVSSTKLPGSDITTSAITPLKVVFSNTSGYSLRKVRKSSLSNRSSTESIDPSETLIQGCYKRAKTDDYSCVQVSELTLKIKRVVRRSGKLGSKIVKFPVYETSQKELKRLGTPQINQSGSVTRSTRSKDKISKDCGNLQRSRRILSKQRGTQDLKCPMLVKASA